MHLRSSQAERPLRPIIEYAQCFAGIYAAEWSEYLDERHLRHLWACDACSYRFETLVIFPSVARPAA